MQHRRKTAPAAVRAALGLLLACGGVGASALAAVGGAAGPGSDPAAAVLQIARQQLGDPYGWGATGPDTWDCSGLTSRLWREVGGVTSIPRTSREQQAWAVPIPAEQLRVGDLVFFGDPVSHVALYAGDGTIVDASESQRSVVERKIWSSGAVRYGRVPRPGMPAVRPWTPPTPTPTATPASTPTSAPAMTRVTPLRGLPGPDLPPQSSLEARMVANARTVRGSTAWTDVALIRTAWRHAGGAALPAARTALVDLGHPVAVGQTRIGDLVVYGAPASHVGVYLGHGYMVDASPSYRRVVVRRVFLSPTVRVLRLPSRAP